MQNQDSSAAAGLLLAPMHGASVDLGVLTEVDNLQPGAFWGKAVYGQDALLFVVRYDSKTVFHYFNGFDSNN